MSEAIILYRGRGSSVDPELLKPKTITTNGIYEAPVTGTYRVSCVGGGGGGGGGCRNSWNSSQVFYGSAGSRGSLTTTNVNLNAGDKIQVNLGSGGVGGTSNTGVVSNNSRGTNGSTGGTTTFSSYTSAFGGTYGAWSWSRHYWSNKISSWEWKLTNVRVRTTRRYYIFHVYDCIVGNMCAYYDDMLSNGTLKNGGMYLNNGYWSPNASSLYRFPSEMIWPPQSYVDDFIAKNPGVENRGGSSKGGHYINVWDAAIYTYEIQNINTPIWNNTILNTSTRCYTSIQTGSWWYTSANNVTTSGTRAYRGDGGNSGQSGNAGFVLVVPPSV